MAAASCRSCAASPRRFHAARAEAHIPGPLVPVARADHFRILDALRAPDGELLRAAAALLEYPA